MLRYVGKANGVEEEFQFLFDKESPEEFRRQQLDLSQYKPEESETLLQPQRESMGVITQREPSMSQSQVWWNTFKMTIMWSAVSFSTYLLHFQLKYLSGNIFTNNNYCAISDAIAVLSGGFIYSKIGLTRTYLLSFLIGIVGGLGIAYLEELHKLQSEHLLNDSHLGQQNLFKTLMPFAIFVAKFGVAMGFLTSYFASFIDDRIFPAEKRATSIGICNLVARGLTGLAPIINEMAEPMPMICFLAMLLLAFINTFYLNLETVPLQRKQK